MNKGQTMTILSDDLRHALGDSDSDVRKQAAAQILEIGAPLIPDLVDLMHHGSKRQQAEAARILEKIGTPEAHAALLPMLTCNNILVAHTVANHLKTHGQAHIDTILAQLLDTHTTVQVLLIDVVENYGDARHIPQLADLLRQTEFAALQREIIDALVKLNADATYWPLILSFAESPDRHVKNSVARARVALQIEDENS